jgi:hypothetical protein
MKEISDAEQVCTLPAYTLSLTQSQMQRRFLDCVETAAFPGTSEEEKRRLLHMVVVGGGPTGIEVAGELHDFLEVSHLLLHIILAHLEQEDLKNWYPELHPYMRLTLVEALPSVLPSFSKELIKYTEKTFKESKIDIMTGTMVKGVTPNSVTLKPKDAPEQQVDCGLVVWAAGNTSRAVTRSLMAKLSNDQTNKRGIIVDSTLFSLISQPITNHLGRPPPNGRRTLRFCCWRLYFDFVCPDSPSCISARRVSRAYPRVGGETRCSARSDQHPLVCRATRR